MLLVRRWIGVKTNVGGYLHPASDADVRHSSGSSRALVVKLVKECSRIPVTWIPPCENR
jgi:hypothetical protein